MNICNDRIRCNVCPQCHQAPAFWCERPAYGSRELYWVGCRKDGHLAGGISHLIAIHNWNRLIAQWSFYRSEEGRRMV